MPRLHVIRARLLLLALPLVSLLAGCSQAQEATTGAASSAASQARTAAADEVKRKICAPVQDGKISAQDKQVLTGLAATAKTAGVPAEITDPLDQIAKAGDQAPADAVTALRKACG